MKRIDVTDDYYAEYNEHSMEWNCLQIKKILNLKLVKMLEFQNIKTFLLKDIPQIAQKSFCY